MDRYLNYKCVLILILIKCVYSSDKSDDLHTGPIPSCDSDDGNFEVSETTERLNKTTLNETITETTQNETVSDIATQTDPQQPTQPIVYYLVEPHPTIQQPTHSGYEPQPQQPQHPQPYTAHQYPGYQPIPIQQPIPRPQLEHYGTGYGPIPIQQPIPPPPIPVTIPIPHPYEPHPIYQSGPYGPYQTQPPQGTGYYGTQQPIPIQQPYQPYQEPQIPIPIPYPQIHIPEQHIQPQPQIQQPYGPQHQQHPPIHQPYGPIPQPIPIPILQPIPRPQHPPLQQPYGPQIPRQQIPYQHPPLQQPIPQIPQHQQIPIHTPPQSPHQGYPIPYQPIQPPPEQGHQHPIPIPRQPIPSIRLTTYGPPRFRPQVPIRLTTYGPPRFRPRGIPGPIIQRPTYMPTTESINYGPTQQTIPTEEPSQEDSKESTEPTQTMEPTETQDSSLPTTHEPIDEPTQAEEPTKEPSAETSTQANTQTEPIHTTEELEPETIPVEIESDEDEEPPKPPSGPGDGDQPPDKPEEGSGEEGDGEEPEEEEGEDKKPPEIIRTCKTITFMKLNEEGKLAEMILEKDYKVRYYNENVVKYIFEKTVNKVMCDGEIVYEKLTNHPYCRSVIYNKCSENFIFRHDKHFILIKLVNKIWKIARKRKYPKYIKFFASNDNGKFVQIAEEFYIVNVRSTGTFKYTFTKDVKCVKLVFKKQLVWEKTDIDEGYPTGFSVSERLRIILIFKGYFNIYERSDKIYRKTYSSRDGLS
ncbi:Theileria-specific sub-telomeric protein, SVSP family, putative [Theileria annulata]|uniref:Theileria-specific sub-telomeric protein, SVSP family, putative n=1 Tax=Theileria annulata TaxID=5874 RepID=Q4UD76_THEAN|nr:Theileria-specific sub-telomeric protein, SVSP family, putative [Theileria annulata]CAI74963.1 Theileria-specific sub-telomeric protein, SVSP family, putative [Theileria annulata]|eukprot:XP_952695.1 Theileria-specific sub-telomeric protein, SVSP family, putative [Theileria annulata]